MRKLQRLSQLTISLAFVFGTLIATIVAQPLTTSAVLAAQKSPSSTISKTWQLSSKNCDLLMKTNPKADRTKACTVTTTFSVTSKPAQISSKVRPNDSGGCYAGVKDASLTNSLSFWHVDFTESTEFSWSGVCVAPTINYTNCGPWDAVFPAYLDSNPSCYNYTSGNNAVRHAFQNVVVDVIGVAGLHIGQFTESNDIRASLWGDITYSQYSGG